MPGFSSYLLQIGVAVAARNETQNPAEAMLRDDHQYPFGRDKVGDWLTEEFTVLGIHFQNWMPVVHEADIEQSKLGGRQLLATSAVR